MKRKYHPPEIKSETAFEQEMLACLKVDRQCFTALPKKPWQVRCEQEMVRLAQCYEQVQS